VRKSQIQGLFKDIQGHVWGNSRPLNNKEKGIKISLMNMQNQFNKMSSFARTLVKHPRLKLNIIINTLKHILL
jgi:DUF2075 family protein